MKIREHMIYAACLACAVLFGALGFWIARLTQPDLMTDSMTAQAVDTAPVDGYVEEITVQDTTQDDEDIVTAYDNQDPEEELPLQTDYYTSPIQENEAYVLPVNLQEMGLLNEQGKYILKQLEDGLSIFFDGYALAHIEIPETLDQKTREELKEGIPFKTMEEIEGWLESLES